MIFKKRLVAFSVLILLLTPMTSIGITSDLTDTLPLAVRRSSSDPETLICGYLFDRGPAGSVKITNLNTSSSWNASVLDSSPDFYYLHLDESKIQAGETLMLNATSVGESFVLDHTVNQSEIDEHIIWLDIIEDLAITDIDLPDQIIKDENTTITARLENIGRVPVVDPFNISLLLDDGILNTTTFTDLPLNSSKSFTIAFDLSPHEAGSHKVTIWIDPANDVSEASETNNNMTADVEVIALQIIRVPTDYPTIQEAIDAAPPGSRIHIKDGEYHLNDSSLIRIVNKSHLWIRGSKGVKFIVDNGQKPPIMIEDSEQIRLSGFTLDTPPVWTKKYDYFIGISNSSMCEIVDSSIMSSNGGNNIRAEPDSRDIMVEWCRLRSIDLHDASIICNNTVEKDVFAGNNSTIYNNTAPRIYAGYDNSTLYNNIASEIYLGRCNNRGCTYSNNSIIYNNYIMGGNSWFAGLMMQGDNNTIYNNTIISLGSYYYPFEGSNNTIYRNNIFGIGHEGVSGSNCWNSTIPVNYTYNGTTFTNYTGNFWYDYAGADSNSDGIGDMAYKITDGYDYYPLMNPFGMTFDLATTAITRPHITYANRTDTILASIERSGTYPVEMDVRVNLTVYNSSSETITFSNTTRMSPEKKILRFTWEPPEAGNYTLKLEVDSDTVIDEMDDGNNEIAINVLVLPPPYNYSEKISSALDFLNESQSPSGSLSGFSGSGYAALAIIAATEDPSEGRWKPYQDSLISYLRKEPKSSAGFLPPGSNPPDLCEIEDFTRMILVISAIGEDPTNFGDVNYLAVLKSYYDGKQFGDPSSMEDDALAILALVACGDNDPRTKDMITNATEYIKAKQNEDGGWGSFGVDSDVKTMSLIIQALIAAGENKDSDTIRTALDYLKATQDVDGGYSDVISTSYAIQAFIAAGEDLSNYNETIDYLLSLQQPDGSFNYTMDMSFFPPRTTVFPILALSCEPYPVMVKTMREGYELPDVSVDEIVIDDEIFVNTSYTAKANIKSNGGIFYVDLLSDDEFVERKMVYSVWYDSLTPVSFRWKPNITGIYNLTIVADSMNNITEFNEENNNITKMVEVLYPDLYPSGITPYDNVYANVTNVIDCTIKGTTDEQFNVTLEADGKLLENRQIECIRGNTTISFEWRPSRNKAYNLNLTVDSDSNVRERDEDNNAVERSVTVLLPDMIPKSIAADEVFVNARNRVNVTIEGFAENFNISLIENGTVVGVAINVTCYGKENVTVYWKPLSLENHTITAFVDSDNNIGETDEGNNYITGVFEVTLPDIVPEEITPDVLYIDEVNTMSIKVNGTAEWFNATLMEKQGIDESGPLCYVITPVVDGINGTNRTFFGADTDFNLTYNITAQKVVWSWEDIDTLEMSIATNTSTGFVDNGDRWAVDYAGVVVNYTEVNSTTVQTLELNVSNVISGGNWSNENNTLISDDRYAMTDEITGMQLALNDTGAIYGNISSVALKVEQHVINVITSSSEEDTLIQKKTNLDTYNGSIEFEWLPTAFGDYNVTVFLDSDDAVIETNETNNNLTEAVYVRSRIDLELTSPVGGEMWEGVRNITWNASYENPILIDLFYSPDRGHRWINITANETDDGSYSWNTEDVIDGEYRMKVVALSGVVTEEDKSDIFYVRNRKAGEEWGSFHENAGYAPCDAPDSDEIAWVSDDIGAEGSSSLIAADGKIFVYCTGWGGMSSDYTYLVALDESNGDILWGTPIAPREYGSWATPAYKSGSIFVSSGNGVYRINADDGNIEWKFTFPSGGGSVNGGPAVTKRAVYVGDWEAPGGGGNYYSFNTSNPGDIFWEFSVSEGGDGRSQSVPAVAYGNVYFGSFTYYSGQSHAYCVDGVTGDEIWKKPTGAVCGSLTVADDVVYFSTYTGNRFYALDAFNGSEVWTNHIGWTDSTPAYMPASKSTRSHIYVSVGYNNPGTTYCLDANTGEVIWSKGGVGYWTNSPVVTKDGKVFAGKYSGGFIPGYSGLYCLDAFTGNEIWHSDYGGSSPVVVNGFVYTIGSGRVFAFGNGMMPDLTVKADATDDGYVAGKEGNITATIENIGKSNVTDSFKVDLRHKGDVIREKTVEPPLNISKPIDVVFEWTPEEPGENRLTVEVDPTPGNVTESNPWNNIANVTVFVEDNKPDLVPFIYASETASVGETIPVDVTIMNIGYETNGSFYVRFFDEGSTSIDQGLSSLENNESESMDFTWTAPEEVGRYRLTILADSDYELDENREDNNRKWVYVNVINVTEPEPTPEPLHPGSGPGYGGGYGGGYSGGIGSGEGAGEGSGAGSGGIKTPINLTESVEDTKKEITGYPFGDHSAGGSGGGMLEIPMIIILLVTVILALFCWGYYREKKTYEGNKK